MKHYILQDGIYSAKEGYMFMIPNTNIKIKKIILGNGDIEDYLMIKIASEWETNREYFLNEVCLYND